MIKIWQYPVEGRRPSLWRVWIFNTCPTRSSTPPVCGKHEWDTERQAYILIEFDSHRCAHCVVSLRKWKCEWKNFMKIMIYAWLILLSISRRTNSIIVINVGHPVYVKGLNILIDFGFNTWTLLTVSLGVLLGRVGPSWGILRLSPTLEWAGLGSGWTTHSKPKPTHLVDQSFLLLFHIFYVVLCKSILKLRKKYIWAELQAFYNLTQVLPFINHAQFKAQAKLKADRAHAGQAHEHP